MIGWLNVRKALKKDLTTDLKPWFVAIYAMQCRREDDAIYQRFEKMEMAEMCSGLNSMGTLYTHGEFIKILHKLQEFHITVGIT